MKLSETGKAIFNVLSSHSKRNMILEEKGREGRKEGRREREGRREGGKEGRREGGKEGGREGGREGGKEGGKEKGKVFVLSTSPLFFTHLFPKFSCFTCLDEVGEEAVREVVKDFYQ